MAACFALNALSFLVVINTLMSLHVKHIPPAQTQQHARRAAAAASATSGSTRELVALIVLAAATTFLGFAVLTFLPLFAQERVPRRRASTYSHLLAFSGAGSVVGALDRGLAGQVQAHGADGAPRAGGLRRCSSSPSRCRARCG